MLVTCLQDERSRYLRSGQFRLRLSAVLSLILEHLFSISLSMLRQLLENVLCVKRERINRERERERERGYTWLTLMRRLPHYDNLSDWEFSKTLHISLPSAQQQYPDKEKKEVRSCFLKVTILTSMAIWNSNRSTCCQLLPWRAKSCHAYMKGQKVNFYNPPQTISVPPTCTCTCTSKGRATEVHTQPSIVN